VRHPWLPALILSAAATWPCAAGEPVLSDLSAAYRGETLTASLRLVDGLSPERLEEIESGIETVLEYRLQVTRPRVGLPDEVLAKKRVECIVRRDALAKHYVLTRRVDGELDERHVATDGETMRDFLTRIDGLPVARVAELPAGAPLEVRARCDLGLQWRFYLIPWRTTTGWAHAAVPAAPPGGEPGGERGNRG
jgi:uncharacterized protein DUF4390